MTDAGIPPDVSRRIEERVAELVADAPPLTDEQRRIIRGAFRSVQPPPKRRRDGSGQRSVD